MPRSLIEAGNTQSATTNTVTVAGNTVVPNMVEKTFVHTSSPSGVVEIDIFKGTVQYFTTPAAGDFQFNFRFSSTPGGINTVVSAGQSLTVAVLVTNGATAYRVNNVLLDGNEPTTPVKWNGANGAPSEGTENSIDTYVFTFIKKLNGSLEILGNAKSTGGTFGAGAGPLYSFTSATFTPGSQTGRTGPALSTARAGLTGTGTEVWKNNTEFFNTTNGIQLWTVPATGTYRIETWGAQGGRNFSYGDAAGLGARMRGDFALTQGEIIRILVGQAGATVTTTCGSAGGGGGTYVVRTPYTTNGSILVIAGGGGGVGTTSGVRAGINATTSQSGTVSNGSNVSGGTSGAGGAQPPGSPCSQQYVSGSGGGFFTNGGGPAGGPGSSNTGGGFAFVNGGDGGDISAGGVGGNVNGSFGGGGKGHYGAGAGGGYSGGGGGQGTSCSCSAWRGGGGGGSYNAGTNQSNSAGVRSGSGQVQITLL